MSLPEGNYGADYDEVQWLIPYCPTARFFADPLANHLEISPLADPETVERFFVDNRVLSGLIRVLDIDWSYDKEVPSGVYAEIDRQLAEGII